MESPTGLKNLRRIRDIAGISQKELAELVPVAHGTVRNIETGHMAYSRDLVEKIAYAVGCGVNYNKNAPVELTLKEMGSNKVYTREWFLYWKEILLRRRAHSRFLGRYSELLSWIFEAACTIDLDEEEKIHEENLTLRLTRLLID